MGPLSVHLKYYLFHQNLVTLQNTQDCSYDEMDSSAALTSTQKYLNRNGFCDGRFRADTKFV